MKNLLLIIDMQEGFRRSESELIMLNILKLVKSFQGEIIFSKFYNQKKSLFETQLNWTRFQNKKDRELFAELRAFDYPIFKHSDYTILNEELGQFLTDNNIAEIYLCGIYTDVCIIKTAMDLFDNGFETFVIENACNSLHGKQNHSFAIDSLKHILGKKQILSTAKICS